MSIAGKPWQFDNLGCYGTEIGENCHLLDDHHRLKIMMTISVFWSLPKTTLSLNITPFQHASYWDTRHVPVGYPVQSIGENGNYRDNRRRLSGWTLPKSTSYVGLFTSFSSVCLWQRWQIKTNSNYFCKVSGIVCIQSLWSQWREEKSIFRSLHELSMVRF